jgi:hypothetical protein
LIAEDPAGLLIAVAAAAVAADDPTGTTGEVGSLYATPIINGTASGDSCCSNSPPGSRPWGSRPCTSACATNVEAQPFYEGLGGRLGGERLFDEDGDLLPERIYTWPDLTTLLTQP